ncbi:hypothetical protein SAMN04487820_101262 [Actinopolyspora mzabensis]|uniref:Uncharacterized protein n=1 Tax=Actinopolyspora mzabensis TaxID=995066 RepID=A0A1G8VQZ4_ACTMZ|nr:hypothetical protein [Actinopolyspora mzabensis]SDJ68399.1 hypothetical protein SAMN04487820_101262 [Actinopolyspora mzabensis]
MTVLGYAAELATERQPLLMVVAQDSGPGVQDEGFGKSTPLALFLILVLLIAVVFLARSMTKQLGKVSTRFDEQRAAAAAPKRVKRAEAARLARQQEAVGTAGTADDAAERTEGAAERTEGAAERTEGAAERTEGADSSAGSEGRGRAPGPGVSASEVPGGEHSEDNAATDDATGDGSAEPRERDRTD